MSSKAENICISICIATFKRPDKLERLLHSLVKALDKLDVSFDVVVVDNDVSRSAEGIIKQIKILLPNVIYLNEPEQNISLARNRAISKARGKWLAFVDDDEIVDSDWLREYWHYQKIHSADGYFGPVLPSVEAETPAWLDAELIFSRPRFQTGTRLTDKMRTGNAFVRASVFEKNKFDPGYGLRGGGDAIFFTLRAKENFKFLWNDAAITYEIYPRERTKLTWLMQRYFRSGLNFSTFRLQQNYSRFGIFLKAFTVLLLLTITLVFRFLLSPKKGVLHFLRMCLQVGHIAACFNFPYYEYKQ